MRGSEGTRPVTVPEGSDSLGWLPPCSTSSSPSCPPVSLSVGVSVHLPVCPSVRPFLRLSTCLSLPSSVCSSVCCVPLWVSLPQRNVVTHFDNRCAAQPVPCRAAVTPIRRARAPLPRTRRANSGRAVPCPQVTAAPLPHTPTTGTKGVRSRSQAVFREIKLLLTDPPSSALSCQRLPCSPGTVFPCAKRRGAKLKPHVSYCCNRTACGQRLIC